MKPGTARNHTARDNRAAQVFVFALIVTLLAGGLLFARRFAAHRNAFTTAWFAAGFGVAWAARRLYIRFNPLRKLGIEDFPEVVFAIRFVHLLVDRQFAKAHVMLTAADQQSLSEQELEAQYDRLWFDDDPGTISAPGVDQLLDEVFFDTMEGRRTAQPGDSYSVYVPLTPSNGDVHYQAVTVIVTLRDNELRVRGLEWGAP